VAALEIFGFFEKLYITHNADKFVHIRLAPLVVWQLQQLIKSQSWNHCTFVENPWINFVQGFVHYHSFLRVLV
jgi:hypothetical protein